jgi:putative serine protease PepD
VPGTWPDDDPAGDGEEEAPFTPPLHPDDRLWRHPSELPWAGLHRGAGQPATTGPAPAATDRPWGLVLASGLVGAALALGAVAFLGGFQPAQVERVVERVGVREQLTDPSATRQGGLSNVVASVSPSVVRLDVDTGDGTVTGSGVVILDDGHIVTNLHVVSGARAVTIVLADGTAVAGEVVGVDELTDLAVVAPADDDNTATWTPAVWGSAADLRVGDPALALGASTDGAEPIAVLAMVSALDRRLWVTTGLTLHGMIQTDTPVDPAASGGALCDRSGRVVGLITTAAGSDGTGFATSMDQAWDTAEALISDGVVHHVWLGIEGDDLDATTASLLGVSGSGGGVVVERVMDGSPAEAAGITADDLIITLDGRRIGSMSDLVLGLREYQPGDSVTFALLRDGERVEVDVALVERAG